MNVNLLFKYKPINTVEQLTRLIDSINNNHIFFPDYKLLNDPLESSGYIIELPGYAGKSLNIANDNEDRIVAEKRQEYRILSLTENCFSPSMWTHYTGDYKGVCIGYWSKGTFSSARKMIYTGSAIIAKSAGRMNLIEYDNIDQEVYESFFYKHSDWNYEKEWRIVKKQDVDFFKYDSIDLACIIFGGNLSEDIRDIIIKSINKRPALYYTKVGYRSFGINLLPIEYKLSCCGEIPPFIKNIDGLIANMQQK